MSTIYPCDIFYLSIYLFYIYSSCSSITCSSSTHVVFTTWWCNVVVCVEGSDFFFWLSIVHILIIIIIIIIYLKKIRENKRINVEMKTRNKNNSNKKKQKPEYNFFLFGSHGTDLTSAFRFIVFVSFHTLDRISYIVTIFIHRFIICIQDKICNNHHIHDDDDNFELKLRMNLIISI